MMSLFACVFFKQKTAYEMRISDWSSDVCSSDLLRTGRRFSFLIGHPWILRNGLRVAVGTQKIADITLAVMGNLVDNETLGAAGRVLRLADRTLAAARSEERRGGKECVRTCRSRWSPYH